MCLNLEQHHTQKNLNAPRVLGGGGGDGEEGQGD